MAWVPDPRISDSCHTRTEMKMVEKLGTGVEALVSKMTGGMHQDLRMPKTA